MTHPTYDDTPLDLDDGGDDSSSVHVGITYAHHDHTAHAHIDTADPQAVADALLTCLTGVAAMHGIDLQLALMTKMGERT